MDTFSPEKRSWIMAQVRSTGNKSTELNLVNVFRQEGITGWRRRYALFGKPDIVFPAILVLFWGHITDSFREDLRGMPQNNVFCRLENGDLSPE